MFEKVESYSYPNVDAKNLHTHAFQWWSRSGFRVQETGPGVFQASSASKCGWVVELDSHHSLGRY